jgi:hypothetical protein
MVGCRRDNTPTPPKYGEVMKDENDRSYRPIRIPDRRGDSVLGPIAAAEQVAAAEKRESAEGARIDDSSAAAIAKSLCQVSASADWKRMSEVLVAEQADAFKAIEEPLVPFLTAVSHFAKAVSEKFEGKVIALQTQDAWLGRLLELTGKLDVQETQAAGEEEAKVTLVVGPADAEDAKKIEMTAKVTDNVWRLAIADFQPPSDADTVAAALEGKATAFEDLASRIAQDEFADADAAKAEAAKIIEGSSKPAEASENNTESAEPAAEPQGPQAAKPAKQPHDDVDDVVAGPTLRRGNQ